MIFTITKFSDIPIYIIYECIFECFLLTDFKNLDSAVTNHRVRFFFLKSLESYTFRGSIKQISYSTLLWINKKQITIQNLRLKSSKIDNKILSALQSMRDLHVLDLTKINPVCGYCDISFIQRRMKCSICRQVYYCSTKCKESDYCDHLNVCPSIHGSVIDISRHVKGRVVKIKKVLPERHLQELNVEYWDNLSDHFIAKLTHNCNLLHTINLNKSLISDKLLTSLASACPLLHTVRLNECMSITENSILDLARSCRHLKNISLDYTRINDAAIAAIATYCPNLATISLRQCGVLKGDALVVLGNNCHELVRIDYIHSNCSDESVRAIAHGCPKLTSFDISAFRVTDSSITELIQHCTQLKELKISGAQSLTHVPIQHLANFHTGLTRLELHWFKASSEYDFDNAIVAVAQRCPNLTTVTLSECRFSDRAIIAIATHCTKINNLNIGGSKGIAGESIPAIAKYCHELIRLDVWGCRLEDVRPFFKLVTDCKKLKKLVADDNGCFSEYDIHCLENLRPDVDFDI